MKKIIFFYLTKSNSIFISIILAFLYLLMLNFTPNVFGLFQPDSESYINFSSIRNSFYPLIIKTFQFYDLELNYLIFLQCLIFGSAIFYITFILLKYKLNKLLIFTFYFSLFLNIYYNGFHHVILTESLSFSFVLIFLSSLISYFYSKNNIYILIISASLSLLVAIKPSGISLIIPALFLGLIYLIYSEKKIKKILFLILIPIIIIFSLENLSFYTFHDNRSSVLKSHFSGKSIMTTLISKKETYYFDNNQKDREIIDFIVNARPYLLNLKKSNNYCLLFERYGDFENYAYFNLPKKEPQFFYKIILENPFSYLKLVTIHYLNFFCVASPTNFKNSSDNPPIISDDYFGEKYRIYLIHLTFVMLGLIFYIITIYYFCYIIYGFIKRINFFANNDKINIFLLFLIHSYFLTFSIISISNPRYLMLVFPLIIYVCSEFIISKFFEIKKLINL